MNKASLVSALAALLIALPEAARAADSPAGGSAADPFAPPPEGKEPSAEDQEAAVLGAPERPSPNTQSPAPRPPGPTTPARPPVPSARTRKAVQANDEAAGVSGADQTGVAIELSTSGFASGTLVGGLFVGGRTASGMILGGFLDYGMTSLNTTDPGGANVTTSAQIMRIGGGIRYSFVQSADRIVDLYGAGDASFDYRSAEVPSTGGSMPTQSMSAAGFSLALGPGLRFWVHDQIAIGYVARLRVTYLTGEAGALTATATENTTDASVTQIGIEGAFQILGVF